MKANSVQTLYSQRAKLYQFFFVDFLKWGKVLEAFFQKNDYLHSEMKILDAGCGTGIVSMTLYDIARRKGFGEITFHGFDFAPAMLSLFLQWIDKEGIKDIQLQQANVLELENQLPGDWVDYDLIVSSAMLEYIPKEKLNRALSNLKKLLKKNGRLLVLVTKRTWLTKWTAAKLWKTNLFDQEELERELQQVGFTAIQKKTLPAAWDSYMIAMEAE